MWLTRIITAGSAAALIGAPFVAATAPAEAATAAAPSPVAYVSDVQPDSYTPPAGFNYVRTYDNWLDCNVAGTQGVALFQWEGYQCYQNDFLAWDLWVHPW